MKHLKKFESFYLSPDVNSDEEFTNNSIDNIEPSEHLDDMSDIQDLDQNDRPSNRRGHTSPHTMIDKFDDNEFDDEFSDDEFGGEDEFSDDDFGDDEFSTDEFSDDEFSDDEFSDDEFGGEDEFNHNDEFPGGHIMKFDESKKSYKKGKKSKPDFLDIDKDGDKKETMKKATKDSKDSKDSKDAKGGKEKGLTAAQKKLPEGLRKAIEARKNKK